MDLIEALQKQMNFCRKKKKYKCGIYVKNNEQRKIAMDVISNILPRRLNKDVELSMGVNYAEVRYENGSLIRIVCANNNERGHRFNGMIVDSTISREMVDTVITPRLMKMLDENNILDRNDNPSKRVYYCDISDDDVIKSTKYKQLLYVTSVRGNGKSQLELKNIMDSIMDSIIVNSAAYKYMFESEENMFEKEYDCMFYENDYDRPVVEKELRGDKVMRYEAWGIPKNFIKYSTEFVNKTKQSFLNVYGKHEITELGFENEINIHLPIDTSIYDGYEVHIEDGMAIVVLHEIKNEAPVLKDYGVE